MVNRFPFALGWCLVGLSKHRWQLQDCLDVAEAAGPAAGLARLDGGGRCLARAGCVAGRRRRVRRECGS